MSTLIPLMIMASGTTAMGALLGLRGAVCACTLCAFSLVVGLAVLA